MLSKIQWRLVAGVALLVAALLLVRWRASDGEPPGAPSPTATATAAPTDTARPTAQVARLVSVLDLDVPEGCELFEWADLTSTSGTEITAGALVHMELQATPCGMQALFSFVEDGDELLIEWSPGVSPDLVAAGRFSYDSERDRWVGATLFEEPGIWIAPVETGFVRQILVEWDSYAIFPASAVNAVFGEPRHVWASDADGALTQRWTLAAGTAAGWLGDPERVAFIQARGGTNVLALGRIESGVAETLFEVGQFPSLWAAPDGRAVAVSWTGDDGFSESRLVAAAGWFSVPDLGVTRSARFWWAPTSDALLALTDGELLVLSPGGGVRARYELDGMTDPYIEWAPDGRYALVVDEAASGTRIDRLDTETLELDLVLDRSVQIVGPDAIEIGPTGMLAIAWREGPDSGKIGLSLLESDELVDAKLSDHVVERFDSRVGSAGTLGEFAWSPTGDRLAFASVGLVLPDGVSDAESSVAMLDVRSGVVRELVPSAKLFTTSPGSLVWSSNGNVVLVGRLECANCWEQGMAYDAIDASTGSVIATVTRPTDLDRWTESLQSLDRLVGELEPDQAQAEFLRLAEGLQLWGIEAAPGGSSFMLVGPPDPGVHVYASGGTTHELEALASFGAGSEVAALLNERWVVVRDGREWARVSLLDGTNVAYRGADTSREGSELAASPSGRLLLASDIDGYVVLDAAAPESEPLAARREWPSGLGERRGSVSWSADESQIVVTGAEAIAVIDVGSGASAVYAVDSMGVGLDATREDEQPLAAAWGVDRTSVIFATRGALWQLDGQSGKARQIAQAPRPGGFTAGTVLAPAPDGSAMAVGTVFGVFLPEPGGAWRLISRVGVSPAGGQLHWSEDASAVVYAGTTASGRPYGVIEVSIADESVRPITQGSDVHQVLGWMLGERVVFVLETGDR